MNFPPIRPAGIAFAVVVGISAARAGGLELPAHGLHSLERAGALVAGADDADALWLDPAGLAHFAGEGTRGFLFDVSYFYQPVAYTAPATPTISNQQPGQPVPTIAGALGVSDSLVIAGGVSAPYMGGLGRYSLAGPQRYAGVQLSGTAFVEVSFGIGYKVSPELRLGATVTDLVTSLDLRTVMWDCPQAMTCTSLDPAYDAPVRVQETSWFAPTGSLGVQYDAGRALTLGAVVQGPERVGGSGTFTTAVPAATAFTGGKVTGSAGSATFWLPPAVRASAAWHATEMLDVEAALAVELWGLHDHVELAPDHVTIATATQTYALGTTGIVRGFHTSVAPSLGAELHAGQVSVAAGIAYETAAAPAGNVTVFAVDAPKLVLGLGGGYREGGWQIGAGFGYARRSDVDVTAAAARVPVLTPLRAAEATYVNAGTYHAYDLVAGLRAARTF